MEDEVYALAEEYGVTITSWARQPMARLAVDGTRRWRPRGRWAPPGRASITKRSAPSSSLGIGLQRLTGETLDLKRGEIADHHGRHRRRQGVFGGEVSLVTNTFTGHALAVTMAEDLRHDILFGRYVADDADYAEMTAGLPDDWREEMVVFNVEDVNETYAFAKALFYEIVDRSGDEVALDGSWDPVLREIYLEEEGEYFMDPGAAEKYGFTPPDYSQRDSSPSGSTGCTCPVPGVGQGGFRHHYGRVPHALCLYCHRLLRGGGGHRLHPQHDHRPDHRQVYDDNRYTYSAPGPYLRRAARNQVRRVYLAPAVAGTALILCFYTMILFFNDGRFTIGIDIRIGQLPAPGRRRVGPAVRRLPSHLPQRPEGAAPVTKTAGGQLPLLRKGRWPGAKRRGWGIATTAGEPPESPAKRVSGG